VRVAVVGGGLAGLTAALDLMDAGVDVTLYEARPTLGGAVQTLPEREGDPQPPPDNGQHIALGCFTEYLRFLDRVGERDSVLRKRLALPVIDERSRVSSIAPMTLLFYRHLPFRDRLQLPLVLARLRKADGSGTFGDVLRRAGASDTSIERFWDVFIRPALNLPTDDVDGEAGLFTVRTALLGPRGNSDLVLPLKPLGWMHGDAAGRVLGERVRLEAKVDSLDELDADAIVVATPPRESARLLGDDAAPPDDSPIVSVHLWFDRQLLRTPLAALLGSDAHWVFDRGALTGERPERGQYLTVVSSGAPELEALRGREIVELMTRELTGRLGKAELLWSRVSREPEATIALRPGVRRPAPGLVQHGVARAGAWLDTGWPVTMESAVASGVTAARALVHDATPRVAA